MKVTESQMTSLEQILALPDEEVFFMLDQLIEFINQEVDEAFEE